MDDWIATTEQMPPLFTDVRIKLGNNPRHDPGDVVLDDTGWWVGYQRAYHPDEVTHWRHKTPADTGEGE